MKFIDNIKNILNLSKILDENKKLKETISELGALELFEIQAKVLEYKKILSSLSSDIYNEEEKLKQLKNDIRNKYDEIIVLEDEILYESFALYKPKFSFTSSEEYKIKLNECRDKQKKLIKDNIAVVANEHWTVNNSAAEGKKMVSDMKKLLLRSFNNECDYCVDNVKFNNFDTNLKRIEKSYEQLNKLGRIMKAVLSEIYLKLKIDELHLAHEYQMKKQEEKEAQKKAREELREQQKLEQEIKIARDKIEKEKKHYRKAINELADKFRNSTSNEDKKEILKK